MVNYCKLCKAHFNSCFHISTHASFCTQCNAEIFPFNNCISDNEFLWNLYTCSYFELNKNIDIERLRCLSVNPFEMNNDPADNTTFQSESDDYFPERNCKYLFSDEFKSKFQNSNKSFSILNVNTRSFPRNFDELQLLLKSLNHAFTAIGISETWFRENTVAKNSKTLKDYSFTC